MKSSLVGLGGRLSLGRVLLVCAGLAGSACAAEEDDAGGTPPTTNTTGYIVGQQLDTNGDGALDGTVVDSTGDGVPDGVDTTGDGIPDQALPSQAATGGTMMGNTTGVDNNTTGTTGNMTGGTNGVDNNMTGTTGTMMGGNSGDVVTTPGHDSNTVVSCGGMAMAEIPCDLKSESCCVTGFASDAAKCSAGTTCSKGNRAQCDGPEDCGSGKVCCVDIVQGTTACIMGNSCPLSAPFQMCHNDKQCPAGQKCKADTTFKWWGNCG